MSYTFIYTEKKWYLKITTVEQLLVYWENVFNPKMKKALDTIETTREFGKGMQHADEIQAAIGITARVEKLSYKEAYEKIIYNHRISQYQALCEKNEIYINKKMGWNCISHKTEQFVHKTGFEFPQMDLDKLVIKQFPMGKHYYVFIDGVQLRKNENLKFNSYDEAYEFAKNCIK